MKTQRVGYLDTLKGWSILLVVFCHYVLLSKETVVGNIIMCIAWGAVPCFMMVSGALMHHSKSFSWRKYFNKLFKLYITLVVWRGIYLIIALTWGVRIDSKVEVFQYLLFSREIPDVSTGVMWYMVAFLLVLLIYPVTWHLFRQGGRQGKQLVCFLAGVAFMGSIFPQTANFLLNIVGKTVGLSVPDFTMITRFLPLVNYGNMIFYFLLGAFLYEAQDRIVEIFSHRKWVPVTGIIVGTLGLLAVKFVQCGTMTWNGTYLDSGYLLLSTVILSVGMFVSVMLIREHVVSRCLAKYVGGYTMGIYYTHYLLLNVCYRYLYPYIPYRSVGANVIKTVLITLVCVLITICVRRIPYVRALVQ